MLIIFSGLPGVGKTAIARELARTIGAVQKADATSCHAEDRAQAVRVAM